MKILAIHADFIEFTAKKKAFKGAEADVTKDTKRIEECLVVFTAAEKLDEDAESKILAKYVAEVIDIAGKVNAKKVVLYPYAHLSSKLSRPDFAISIMKEAEIKLRESGDYEVVRAPFGWYKSFNISCKGHPLSELSRNITAEDAPLIAGKDLKKVHNDIPFEFEEKEASSSEKVAMTAGLVLAKAVKELYPDSIVADVGFYHEQVFVDFSGVKIKQKAFGRISSKMQEIITAGTKISVVENSKIESKWQKEILADIGSDKKVFSLDGVNVVPLLLDAVSESVSAVGAFELVGLGSIYWKGNQQNKQLVRLRLVAYENSEQLESYKKKHAEAEARSHIKIGKEQGLFVISDLVGAGMPLFAPKGMIIKKEITDFLWDLHKNRGYSQVGIPHIAKTDLYKTSGHWEKFGEELFKVKGHYEDFVLKPMNCPHHTQIFDAFSYSYRDLPVRFFEPTVVYRDEKPGQLTGLSRVRAITQDDGHIFCRVDQIEQEVATMIDIVLKFYKTFGMDADYWVSLSVRGDDMSKYLGSNEVWDIAENALEKSAKDNKLPFKRIEGEAAFYGPKLDFMFKDALDREWQLATIQCDFNLPNRFDLSYVNEKGEKERPVMLHRAISGALERFMSVMIEHFAGKFPLWISPVQVKIVTVADRHEEFARKLEAKFQSVDLRSEVDNRRETIGKKIREAQLEHVNYILTIGDKELEAGTLAVRNRESGKTEFGVAVDEFVAKLVVERDERRLSE
ncbi:threonine--tRNA ligase [archaeon]|jgi:threonyl-tRNA synthetase|nr:threonine--tRNA ligase [archaeon]MBT6762022.1 threonine--tRNA ligase [archaeon]